MKLRDLINEIVQESQNDPEHGYNEFLPFLQTKLKVKVKNRLASGSKSDVFDIGGGKVLKITKGSNDANGMMLAKEHPDYPIPKVFGIYKFNPLSINPNSKFKQTLYAIVSEKIDATNNFNLDDEADLEDWFLNNTKYVPDDIHAGNMGKRGDGTIVYTDPSFENTENYLSKIPEIKP